VGGVLIHPKFSPRPGMLGTTFGGNPLACAASLAVLEVLEKESLQENAARQGAYLKEQLSRLPQVKAVAGEGLMLGLIFEAPVKALQQALLEEAHILTGSSSRPNEIRLLPPLNIDQAAIDTFISQLISLLARQEASAL
jgi:acetylornithine/N-succinyldiaminopimelate aminotransferase